MKVGSSMSRYAMFSPPHALSRVSVVTTIRTLPSREQNDTTEFPSRALMVHSTILKRRLGTATV